MTTGATGQLGLALPVQGELSGTWGNTVNNAITEYTNIAIAGTLTLTGDGAVTLANTTGTDLATNITSSLTGAGTVTAQFAIVRVTGTLTTPKIITAPSYSKTYVVVNAATGSTVSFIRSGQTPAVSIAVGESAWVYYNGTDYVKIAGTTSGSAGGSNTQVQYNSSGSLAGSSNLTFDGTNLTLGGGTANGVTYLNGSKVLTSGSALTYNGTDLQFASGSGLFTNTSDGSDTATLAIGGGGANSTARGSVIELYGNENATAGVLDMTSGNVANSYVRIQGRSSTSYVRFDINASEQMRLTSTGLGIGTSSPINKLQVAGAVAATGGAGGYAANMALLDVSGGNAQITAIGANTSTVGTLVFQAFSSNASLGGERARIDSSGNFGIGTTAPSDYFSTASKFVIANTSGDVGMTIATSSTGTGNIFWADATSGTGEYSGYIQYAHNGDSMRFGTAATERARIDSSGNLGLGVTPSAWGGSIKALEGFSTSGSWSIASGGGLGSALNIQSNAYYDGSNWIYKSTSPAANYYQSAGTHVWRTAASGTAGNAISFTQAMTLSATGGLSVGTTSDPGAGAIYATGNITAFFSDKRLKTVSGKIENALDKVGKLSGVYYTFNDTAKSFGYDSDEEHVGVIAQEVEAVLPQIVKAAPFDLDENNNSKSGENYKTVQYDKLVPLLIEAINELQAKVKALEAK